MVYIEDHQRLLGHDERQRVGILGKKTKQASSKTDREAYPTETEAPSVNIGQKRVHSGEYYGW